MPQCDFTHRAKKALAAHPGDVEAALTEYEQAMFARSTEITAAATEFFESMAGENPAQTLADLLTDAVGNDTPRA